MKLINGRGQLGEIFKTNLDKFIDINATLYHTWNFEDKRFEVQNECLDNFVKYVLTNQGEKIIFISTKSKDVNNYTKFKLLAENFLINNSNNYLIIRLPNILGKGICNRFITEPNIKPFGRIELITLNEAYNKICLSLDAMNSIVEIHGEMISANLVREMLIYNRKVN